MSNATAVARERATTPPKHANAAATRRELDPAPQWPGLGLQHTTAGATPQSPTLIVITMRPEGPKFNGHVGERAEEAGFVYLQPTTLGFAHSDTGKEVARLVGARHTFDGTPPREIQVHIDPETCPLQWGAGSRLFEKIDKYALLIGGSICDGLGNHLSPDDKAALEKHINDTIKHRSDMEKRARTVTLPDGEQRQPDNGGLSFCFTVIREAGSRKKAWRSVYFEARPMHYYEGKAHACRMIQEVVTGFKEHKIHKPDIVRMLAEVFEKTGTKQIFGDYGKESLRNVTSEFLELIETLVRLGAGNMNPKWLEQKIAHFESQHAEHQANLAAEKEKLVEQLRRGREAAKARRAAEGKA